MVGILELALDVYMYLEGFGIKGLRRIGLDVRSVAQEFLGIQSHLRSGENSFRRGNKHTGKDEQNE